ATADGDDAAVAADARAREPVPQPRDRAQRLRRFTRWHAHARDRKARSLERAARPNGACADARLAHDGDPSTPVQGAPVRAEVIDDTLADEHWVGILATHIDAQPTHGYQPRGHRGRD